MSIRLLEHMRDELIATGIVQNTPEFCHSWLGRSEGYIRVLRYHNTEPSVDAEHLFKQAWVLRSAIGCQ